MRIVILCDLVYKYDLFCGEIMVIYFISRHFGAVEWAKELNVSIDVWLPHLDESILKAGDVVIGTLPINIVAKLNQMQVRYFHLELELSMSDRGKELTKDDLYRLNACIIEYEAKKKTI